MKNKEYSVDWTRTIKSYMKQVSKARKMANRSNRNAAIRKVTDQSLFGRVVVVNPRSGNAD